jgi:hypothetical protein
MIDYQQALLCAGVTLAPVAPIRSLVAALPFCFQILSPAIRACIVGENKQVTSFAHVSEEALCSAVDASVEFVKQRLLQKHRRVKRAMGAQLLHEKDIEDGKFSIRKMASGSLNGFHNGLTDRIGERALCACQHSAFSQMVQS